MGSTAHEQRRQSMLDIDLRGRGVLDERVLAAMAAVPRDRFVPADLVDSAYADRPLPIACGQTISQPFIVAAMAEALDLGPTDTVLEVGTGSGYGAAVLSRLAASVVTTERHPAL
ncbi:MAG: protein-L-isoaspartate O-methyltransferase, partial [Acidimicrobiia bacterium]|nr:protein-L-isoaspartate O-methyltransferase [Acidimicrobiia bacterium]